MAERTAVERAAAVVQASPEFRRLQEAMLKAWTDALMGYESCVLVTWDGDKIDAKHMPHKEVTGA
jgi:peroxiredoxin family protein